VNGSESGGRNVIFFNWLLIVNGWIVVPGLT
jgi:hypothetical protein